MLPPVCVLQQQLPLHALQVQRSDGTQYQHSAPPLIGKALE